jgi:regulatory GntR family protein
MTRPYWMNDPEITGEHEIDIGLRPKPMMGRFVKGPIPLDSLVVVNRLPGKAWLMLLLTYHRTAMSSDRWITLSRNLLEEFGVSREAKRRALRQLEAAGLVQTEQLKGYQTRMRLILRQKRQKRESKQ